MGYTDQGWQGGGTPCNVCGRITDDYGTCSCLSRAMYSRPNPEQEEGRFTRRTRVAGLGKRLFTSSAVGEELANLIHIQGFKRLDALVSGNPEHDEYLDADGNHCLATIQDGPYEIYECDGVDCSFWPHASDMVDPT